MSIAAPMSVSEVHKMIRAILIKLEEGSTTEALVPAIEKIKSAALKSNLAYKQRIHPRRVGVHKSNRNGLGVIGYQCHNVGKDVQTLGFSFGACSEATCGEDDELLSNRDFTTNLQANSEYLGDPTGEVDFAALVCTHLNQFLFAALDGNVECEHPEISMDGKISTNVLTQGRAGDQWQEALTGGLNWFVFRREVFKEHPSLPKWVQAADNAKGQVLAWCIAVNTIDSVSIHKCIYIYVYTQSLMD